MVKTILTSIEAAIVRDRMPKISTLIWLGILLCSERPTSIPAKVAVINGTAIPHKIAPFPAYEIALAIETKAMTASDVATITLVSKLEKL